MRLGHEAVIEVVNRHHSTEPPPSRCSARKTVNDIHPRASRQARQQLLFAPDPLDPVPGPYRHCDRRYQLAPRPTTLAGSFTVHERCESRLRRSSHHLRNQLPRVHLHAAGFAWNEEDEVQATCTRGRASTQRADGGYDDILLAVGKCGEAGQGETARVVGLRVRTHARREAIRVAVVGMQIHR